MDEILTAQIVCNRGKIKHDKSVKEGAIIRKKKTQQLEL